MLRILVCAKQVPDGTEVALDENHSLLRDSVAQIMNPADEAALEHALTLKDTRAASVTVTTMGKQGAEDMLREAASRGADRLILLHDKAFAGADTLATAKTLRAAVEKAGPFDLVFCGRRAVDGETGQVGPELASLLGAAVVPNAVGISMAPDSEAEVAQMTEQGGITYWRCPALPAVVTFCERSKPLRLPSIMGLRRAREIEIVRWGMDALGLAPEECGLAGSPTRVVRVEAQPLGVRRCEWVTTAALLEKGVLP